MNQRSVIWITLESIRLDHTQLGEHSRPTTPHLVDFASDGFSTLHCYSHAIWTRPTTASILTGEAPSAHRTWSNDAKLPSEIKTIPEAFSESGYSTVGISTTPHISDRTGLDRGFDDFHYINKSSVIQEVETSDILRYLANIRRHSGGLTTDTNQHCFGYLINKIAKKYIKKNIESDSPLFLYMHQPDTHHPFVPPIQWRDQFLDDLLIPIDDAIELALQMSKNLSENIATENAFTDEEWETLRILYDTCIAYVDHLIYDLITYAEKHLIDPIIVITSDHGEQLGECGLLAHILVPNSSVTNVPLVIKGIRNLDYGGLLQHADVMNMIANDQGIDHPVRIGQDVRDTAREFAVTQRGDERAPRLLDIYTDINSEFPSEAFHRSVLTSVRSKSWRYQWSDEGEDLYRLPDEETNVAVDHPDVVKEFREYGREWMENYGGPVGSVKKSEFDAEMTQKLKDLGYLS